MAASFTGLPTSFVIAYALAAALLPAATPGSVCTKDDFVGVRLPGEAHFTGTALADTLFTGPGSVAYRVQPGHFGPARERAIYGQLVSIEQIGGLAAVDLPASVSRVVLVAWDYGPECTPTPWPRSARWIEAGTRGLFIAGLRDSAHWTNGLPTFDVHEPQFVPYPHRILRFGHVQADSLLTIEQLFALMEILPEADQLRNSPDSALQPLFAWARANPELAIRYPADDALWYTYEVRARHIFRNISPTPAGTYRFTFSMTGAAARTLYVRTRAVPTRELFLRPVERPADPTQPPPRRMAITSSFQHRCPPADCQHTAERKRAVSISLIRDWTRE